MKEVIQPKIVIPDHDDPLTWASLARTHQAWLREVCPQIGLDVSKMVLGDVLTSIIGDDGNALASIYNPAAHIMKAHILERMDWEIFTPETPEELRIKLTEVVEKIKPLNFAIEEDHKLAKTTWWTMERWVKEEIKKRPEWKEAKEYYENSKQIWPYWKEFLWGTKDPIKKWSQGA